MTLDGDRASGGGKSPGDSMDNRPLSISGTQHAEASSPPVVRRRILVYAALFSIAAILFGGVRIDLFLLEQELHKLSEDRMKGLRTDEYGSMGVPPFLRMGAAVTASREYLVVGEPRGKLTVYIQQSPDIRGPIRGVEYFFEREDGEWRQIESGTVSPEECVPQGYRVLRALQRDADP